MEDSPSNQISNPSRGDWSRQDRADTGELISLPRLVLASASPRRAEILRAAGWPFDILPVDIDEIRRPAEEAVSYVSRLAFEKAAAAASQVPSHLVLGADTVVVIENEILGKPLDNDDARRMLNILNGRWHQVLTGVCLQRQETNSSIAGQETTQVKFADMSDAEIDWYISTGEPQDKAGAYAIQGRGARLIEGIKGDYFNVVGLPVRLVYKLAKQF